MRKLLLIIAVVTCVCACNNRHLITDEGMRNLVNEHFAQRQDLLKINSHLNVFEKDLSLKEKEALKFLYAYMPIGDIADYKGDFFLGNVQTALRAREDFHWGDKVPLEEFMHFVLPYRVNNENLDTARQYMYSELKDRVKNLSMYDAALEVNHWCHEKVTYKGTSIRTSAPLSTIRTAYGRCGEESTLTVTALRAVGIPARQVYTPRWAHCDDNHAWVEAWVDGQWYFLGACEPSPKLNMGWFARTSKRAMMVHTKVFGDYNGSERILNKTKYYTHLNTLENYAQVKLLKVVVKDVEGNVVEGAEVRFGLYNYAEFYPIVTKLTGKDGSCEELTGYGDLLISASKNGAYGYGKADRGDEEVEIVLDGDFSKEYSFNIDIIPPRDDLDAVREVPEVSEEEELLNQKRLKEEDSVRSNYEETFMSKEDAYAMADKLGYDNEDVWTIIKASRGNWYNIKRFLENVKENKEYALKFLCQISEKDKRDTEYDVLIDLFESSFVYSSPKGDMFEKYVLNPRVRNELLSPYKSYFQQILGKGLINSIRQDPTVIISEIRENVLNDSDGQYYSLPIKPIGVHTLKRSDKVSADICFVAVCRALGIPARLQAGTEMPEYYKDGSWHIAEIFSEGKKEHEQPGFLKLSYSNNKHKNFFPKYYIHFTLAKYERGRYKTLEYDWERPLNEFPEYIELAPGSYRMVTGNRMEDGSVLGVITFFNINEGEKKEVELKLRKAKTTKRLHGSTDMSREVFVYDYKTKKSLSDLAQGNTVVAVWADPEKEPTKHVLADFKKSKDIFEKWNGNILLIVEEDKISDSFDISRLRKDMPNNTVYCLDSKPAILGMIAKDINKRITHYPVILVIDKDGQVRYFSMDYRIGIDEQILNTVNAIE